MNILIKTKAAKWLLIVLLAGLAGGCGTVTKPGGPARPAAEERRQERAADVILKRWIEVQGGKAAIAKIAGIRAEVAVQYGPGWPELVLISKEAAGGKFSWELVTPVFGSFFTVSDGRVAMMHNEKLGAGLMDARMTFMAMRDSDPQKPLKMTQLFPVRRRLADVVEKEVRMQVIALTDTQGVTEKWFMDEGTGQRLKSERPEVVMTFSDFRKDGGFSTAYVVENSRGFRMRLKSISYDARFADADFYVDPAKVAEAEKITKIMRQQVEAVGREALDRVLTRSSTAVVDLEKDGMTFSMNIRQKRPNFVLIEQDIPSMGKIFQGFDGKTGWASSEMQGYRELKGPELMQLLSMADLGADIRLQEMCPLRKLVGERELPRGIATGIELGSLAGPNGTYWFENRTGRLVRIESAIMTGPNSHVTMVMDMDDFRLVDGVWVPFTTRVENPALKMVTRMKSVENNVTLDDAIFKPRTDD